MFVYVLFLARTYIRIIVYVLVSIFTYLHIIPLSIDREDRDKGRDCEKERVGEGGENELLQS